MSPEIVVECAWCGSTIESSETEHGVDRRVSHGVCLECLGGILDVPVSDMHSLGRDEVDELPFGFMELTRMGVVRKYNAAESHMSGLAPGNVIGKDFFREVAPCTQATEFEDRWRALFKEGGGDADFRFIFKFRTGHRLVRIRMLVDVETGRNLILVQDLDRATESESADSRRASVTT